MSRYASPQACCFIRVSHGVEVEVGFEVCCVGTRVVLWEAGSAL